jgi:hypothetical protein
MRLAHKNRCSARQLCRRVSMDLERRLYNGSVRWGGLACAPPPSANGLKCWAGARAEL